MNQQTPENTAANAAEAGPDTDAAAQAGTACTDSGKPSRRPRILLAAVVIAGAAYLGHALWFDARYVRTDNAEVGGDIIPVSARISGFVTSVGIRENQAVKPGDTLVTLDDRDARARLAQAEADLASALSNAGQGAQTGQAVAQVQAAEAQASQARAVIEQARAEHDQALRDLQRLRTLLARDVISQHDVDAADALERTTRARLKAAEDAAQASRRQVGVYSAAVRGADARVLAARAARDLAANTLDDTRVVAASAGMVSQKTVEPGQYVQPGQPMMNLVVQDSIWVVANLKETEIEGVRIGNPVSFSIDAYPGETWQGTVESISPATGSKFTLLPPDNATGNFTKVVQRLPVRVHVDAGQHRDLPLRAGMSAVVTITRG